MGRVGVEGQEVATPLSRQLIRRIEDSAVGEDRANCGRVAVVEDAVDMIKAKVETNIFVARDNSSPAKSM